MSPENTIERARNAPIDIAEYNAWHLACDRAGITWDIKYIAAK